MKITWLGQLGLAIEWGNSTIVVDPYLSDSLYEKVGDSCRRMVPVDEKWLNVHPDMILLTHDHSDHLDVASLKTMMNTEKRIDILGGMNAWKKARTELGGNHNFVLMSEGTEWTAHGANIVAIPAVHSDDTALGYIIHADGKSILISGDTLYNERVIESVHEDIDVMFVVMNGCGNNMNYVDAARMSAKICPKMVIPVHWGMFEAMSAPPEPFCDEVSKYGINSKIITVYGAINLER